MAAMVRMHEGRVAPVWLAMALIAAGSLLPSAVAAQQVPPNQGIADRPRPGFEPLGIDVPGFTLFPTLATDVVATDNFRASNTNRESDVYLVVAPEARLRSDWARHDMSARAYFSRSIHANLTSEDVSQFGTSANGSLDISRESQINFNASFDRKAEGRADLGSFLGTPSPVNFNVFRFGVSGAQTFNRLGLKAGVAIEKYDFFDVAAADGSILDQDFRDVRTVIGSASAQLEVRSGISALVSAQFDNSSFTNPPSSINELRRDSSGYTILAGVSLELSSLVFGQIQVGIIDRRYEDPRLKDVRGPSYRANLLWNVTPLTSLRLTGARTIEDTSSTVVAGNTRSEIGLSVDHELYRYIILSGNTAFSHFSPNGPGADGNEFSIAASARYLASKRLSIDSRLRYAQRSSSNASISYHATAATITARIGF